MEDNKTVVLDLSNCKRLLEMHRRIKEAFEFPDFYGENWPAFYDLMRSDCPAERVLVRGVSTMSESLSRQLEMMKATLESVKKHHAKYNLPFHFVIED